MAIFLTRIAQRQFAKFLGIPLGAIAIVLLLSSPAFASESKYYWAAISWSLQLFMLPMSSALFLFGIPLIAIIVIEAAILKWKEDLSIATALGLMLWVNCFYIITLIVSLYATALCYSVTIATVMIPITALSYATHFTNHFTRLLVIYLPVVLAVLPVALGTVLMYQTICPRRKWLKFLSGWRHPVFWAIIMGCTFALFHSMLIWSEEFLPLAIPGLAGMAGLGILFSWSAKGFALRVYLHQHLSLSKTITAMHLGTIWIWPIAFYFMQARI